MNFLRFCVCVWGGGRGLRNPLFRIVLSMSTFSCSVLVRGSEAFHGMVGTISMFFTNNGLIESSISLRCTRVAQEQFSLAEVPLPVLQVMLKCTQFTRASSLTESRVDFTLACPE